MLWAWGMFGSLGGLRVSGGVGGVSEVFCGVSGVLGDLSEHQYLWGMLCLGVFGVSEVFWEVSGSVVVL